MPEEAPFPHHDCPACERGERTVTPPHSSVVGSMPVHQPSGNVCVKWIKPAVLEILRRQQQERAKQVSEAPLDTVQREDLPPAAVELVLYDQSSPARPGNEPQDGDVDFTLRFPLHDGTRLVLHLGDSALGHFVGMMKAYEADEAKKPKPDGGLIIELGAFGRGKAATFTWVMMKIGETVGSTLAMFILAAAIAAGGNEKLEINIAKVLRIMRELADQYGVDMRDVDIVPTSDQQ
jgi:hypothetical protein